MEKIENTVTPEVGKKKFHMSEKAMSRLVTGATFAGMVAMSLPMVCADTTSAVKETITAITTLVKYIGVLLGIVYGIFGFLHYAAANAEGDGPGKNKAQNQLAAALMLIAISIIVGLVNWSNIYDSVTK